MLQFKVLAQGGIEEHIEMVEVPDIGNLADAPDEIAFEGSWWLSFLAMLNPVNTGVAYFGLVVLALAYFLSPVFETVFGEEGTDEIVSPMQRFWFMVGVTGFQFGFTFFQNFGVQYDAALSEMRLLISRELKVVLEEVEGAGDAELGLGTDSSALVSRSSRMGLIPADAEKMAVISKQLAPKLSDFKAWLYVLRESFFAAAPPLAEGQLMRLRNFFFQCYQIAANATTYLILSKATPGMVAVGITGIYIGGLGSLEIGGMHTLRSMSSERVLVEFKVWIQDMKEKLDAVASDAAFSREHQGFLDDGDVLLHAAIAFCKQVESEHLLLSGEHLDDEMQRLYGRWISRFSADNASPDFISCFSHTGMRKDEQQMRLFYSRLQFCAYVPLMGIVLGLPMLRDLSRAFGWDEEFTDSVATALLNVLALLPFWFAKVGMTNKVHSFSAVVSSIYKQSKQSPKKSIYGWGPVVGGLSSVMAVLASLRFASEYLQTGLMGLIFLLSLVDNRVVNAHSRSLPLREEVERMLNARNLQGGTEEENEAKINKIIQSVYSRIHA